MAEEREPEAGFKVVDRRSFSADGKRVSDEPEKTDPKPEARRVDPPAALKPESPGSKSAVVTDSKDFEMLVSYLSTTAMFQLGLVAGPEGEHLTPDPGAARQTIGFLEALRAKTSGNLTPNESSMIDGVMYELRMTCMEIEKRMVARRK